MKTRLSGLVICLLMTCHQLRAQSQKEMPLTLNQAIIIGVQRHELLKAKTNYRDASLEGINAAKKDGLPDVIVSAQQAYGTLNGLNGLPSGMSGLIATVSGPVSNSQNWNAAFTGLYASEIDWNVFAFGLQRAHVAEAKSFAAQSNADLEQEAFRVKVQIAGAYLNLLAARQLRNAADINLWRVSKLRDVILTRTKYGLNAGVDSTIANAELSKARIALNNALNYEQNQAANLAIQLNINEQSFALDTTYNAQIPASSSTVNAIDTLNHPELRFLMTRVNSSLSTSNYIAKTGLPRVTAFGTWQERGSGFSPGYQPGVSSSYSRDYLTGVDPIRQNYFVGVGITWNISALSRSSSRSKAQRLITEGLKDEYNYMHITLNNQLEEGNKRIKITLENYKEAPLQLDAAEKAYAQKEALYNNGLATIVDVTQALYNLNAAETDLSISGNAVWQSFLYISASSGNLDSFLKLTLN